MNPNLADAIKDTVDDPDFKRKYGIAAICAIGSVVIAPGIILLGYLAQTMKRATLGRKGLPDWKDFGEMCTLGGVGLLSMLYLLPAALLTAMSVLPVLSGNSGFLSVSALISRFIYFGAILAFVAGLAFTVTGIHSYLQTQRVSDLFKFNDLFLKIKSKLTELGTLIAMAGVATVGLAFLNWLLGWLGALISVAGYTFVFLVVAYRTGAIFGSVALPAGEEMALPAAASDQPISALPAEATSPEVASIDEDDPFADDSEDSWKPR